MIWFLLGLLCWAAVTGIIGYEVGRHRKYDEAYREGCRDGFRRGAQHEREGLADHIDSVR